MQRPTRIILTGSALLSFGFASSTLWPGILPGRILEDSDLASIRGLNPQNKSDQISPVGCEAFNLGNNQVTPDKCKTEKIPPPNQQCVACSDKIATFVSTGPNDPGNKQFNDGNYQCSGQKSTAPCQNPKGQPFASCGNFMPVNGVFCTGTPIDWDPE